MYSYFNGYLFSFVYRQVIEWGAYFSDASNKVTCSLGNLAICHCIQRQACVVQVAM